MSRHFGAPTDRIFAPAPAVWPAASGTIFLKIKPDGWGAGVGGDFVFFSYGYFNGSVRALLLFQRFSDHKAYVGWFGDASHGGEQRIIVPDTGCFANGVWSNHAFTWDSAAGQAHYYVDGAEKGARKAALLPQTLSGQPTSNVTIGNHNVALGNVDARSSLAFFARWNRVLTPDEIAQLQNDAHPLALPTALVECIDLGAGDPERDLQSAVTYTLSGTTVEPDPMKPASEIRRWAKKFEPILLFHPDEQFFPIDPKWYLEQCSLWRALPPDFSDRSNWGEPPAGVFPRAPLIAKFKLAALAGETSPVSDWLGAPGADLEVATAPEGEAPPRQQERFLDFAGWEPPIDPPNEVTSTSTNRHAALNPADYASRLSASRPWYYAEYMDVADLRAFAERHRPNGLDVGAVLTSKLNNPRALLYYFLYPMHQEALENCAGAGEGGSFATYAGEWACIALVMDASDRPRFIGLSSRNVAAPSQVATEDKRIGMTVFPWTAVGTVPDSTGGEHPKIFVSLGTHGHYVSAGPHTVTVFSGGIDLSSGSCGAIEAADDVIAGDITIPGAPSDLTPEWILVTKGILAAVTAGIGALWILAETSDDKFGSIDELVSPTTPTDITGGPMFGKIYRPDGLAFSEITNATSAVDWHVDRFAAADGRVYDSFVCRPAQVWWPPRRQASGPIEGPGWFGRWGPRVTNDPFNRRAGGKCPDFAAMFLEAVAIALNK